MQSISQTRWAIVKLLETLALMSPASEIGRDNRQQLNAHRFEDKEEEVVDDPTDPHEDMLTDRDWQRLENHNVDYEEELENEA